MGTAVWWLQWALLAVVAQEGVAAGGPVTEDE